MVRAYAAIWQAADKVLPGGIGLRLLEERRFDGGVVHLRYAVLP